MKVAQNRLEQLQPIASARDSLQSDSATIADACEEWVTLLQVESLNPHRQKINSLLLHLTTFWLTFYILNTKVRT